MTKSSFTESSTSGSNVPAAERWSAHIRGGLSTLVLVGFSIFWCLVSSSFAQSVVDIQTDSARAPFSTTASYLGSFQFESINPTTGKPGLVGTPTKMQVDFLKSSSILADIPGNKTSALTVSSLRATFVVTGLIGWEPVGPFSLRASFTPFAIAPGQKVGCRYDMPAQTFNVLTLSFGPAGSGRLRCQPGVLAADIPAPVVASSIDPVLKPWITIAQQHQSFTLQTVTIVRYGEISTNRFVQQTLQAGVYVCDNAQFTDPAIGVDLKVCQSQ